MKENLFFVGPGRAGLALGHALMRAGAVGELTYCGRRPEPPFHPLFADGQARYVFGLEAPRPDTTAVFLSVPDDVLAEVAHALAAHGSPPPGCAAFHLSGALSTDILAPLHEKGYLVGSLHLLQSLAHPLSGADRIPGSFGAVSGEPGAVTTGRRLLGELGCRALAVPATRRPLYHAAAVTVSNHLVALLGIGSRILERAGIPEEDALAALLPLARGTLANVEEMGVGQALTGPLVRGDVETVSLHLRALEGADRDVYRRLALELVEMAGGQRLDPEVEEEMRELLGADS